MDLAMTSQQPSVRNLISFAREWLWAIIIGTVCGLAYIVLTMEILAVHVGDVLAGAVTSFAGIGIALLVTLFLVMFAKIATLKPHPKSA